MFIPTEFYETRHLFAKATQTQGQTGSGDFRHHAYKGQRGFAVTLIRDVPTGGVGGITQPIFSN